MFQQVYSSSNISTKKGIFRSATYWGFFLVVQNIGIFSIKHASPSIVKQCKAELLGLEPEPTLG